MRARCLFFLKLSFVTPMSSAISSSDLPGYLKYFRTIVSLKLYCSVLRFYAEYIAVCKILFESRSLPTDDMMPILDTLWTLGQTVRDQQVIEVEYQRMKDPQLVKRRMQPVGIMFSEYYFYLTAFL